jgi:site-specific recombinase XerC
VSLAGAVPAVAGWRLASLPRGLDTAVVTALLDSCDRDTIAGRRDHAILMLLARLGLRGAEVADLRLGMSTGAVERSPSEARATASIGFRCPAMSVSRWWCI